MEWVEWMERFEQKFKTTRGHGGLNHYLHSEAPARNHRMAMTFAKLRLIVFLWCIGHDWMPLSLCSISHNLLRSLYHA